MTYFTRKNNQLHCEEVPLEDLARTYQTPLYVYSHTALRSQFEKYKEAFSDVDHLVCFSMKANSSLSVLKTFIGLGGGIDVVTGGELYRARLAGCPADKIVFSGVGKNDEEIRYALDEKILQFNVESEDELARINKIATEMGLKAPVAIRVNPDVDPKTHPYIATGFKKSKFGISHKRAVSLYEEMKSMSGIEIVGIDCHIGSQLTQVDPFIEAMKRIRDLIVQIQDKGISLKQIDIGGGLGIIYDDETPPSPQDYAQAIKSQLKDLKLRFIMEPGRNLVGNSGVLLTKVLYKKQGEVKNFVIVDAASNDLWRPSLYNAYHAIEVINQDESKNKIKVDIVGPICESGDFFAQDRMLQDVDSSDILAIMSAGAYGFSMASTYNSRPKCAEVMVSGSKHEIIREREKVEDLVKGEKVASFIE